MKNRKAILMKNTMWVYLAKILAQMVSVLATVLVIRHLEVEVYGTYTFLFGVFTLYQIFVTSPLRQVITRFVPEFSQVLSLASIWQMVKGYFLAAVLQIIALTAVIVVFKSTISAIFNVSGLVDYIGPFLFFVFAYALKILLEVVLSALLLHKKLAVLNVLVALLRALAYIGLLTKLDVGLLLVIEACVSIVYALISLYYLWAYSKKSAIQPDAVLSMNDKKRFRKFWWYSVFTEMGVGVIGRTSDFYIVAALSNPYFIGLYGFATKIFDLFYKFLPLKEFESVLRPLIFERYQSDTSSCELNRFYNFSVKIMLPVFILPFLYFSIYGHELIGIVFDDRYQEAYWTTVVVLAGLVLHGLFYPLGMIIHLKEKLHVQLYSRIVVIFSLLMGVYLMKHWGIAGVALATLGGELIKNGIMYILVQPYCRIVYDKSLILNYSVMIVAMLLISNGIKFLLFNSFIAFLLGTIIFVLFYVIYLVNFHPLNTAERQLLNSIFESNDYFKKIYKAISRFTVKLAFVKRAYES